MTDEQNDTNPQDEDQHDPIREAFDDMVEDSHSEDEVKLAMINAGAKFSNVTRLYTQYMVDAGLAMSKDEKQELTDKILADSDVSTEEGFIEARDALVEDGTNISEKQAASIIRAYAKKNDLEIWKARPGGGGGGRLGFRGALYDALRANPSMTEKELNDMIATHELSSENVKNHQAVFQGIRKLCNDIAAA